MHITQEVDLHIDRHLAALFRAQEIDGGLLIENAHIESGQMQITQKSGTIFSICTDSFDFDDLEDVKLIIRERLEKVGLKVYSSRDERNESQEDLV